MGEPEQKKQRGEVCSIRIMFPVETDEQAIVYKKKISEILADRPEARIEFSLMSRPLMTPNGS